MSSRDFGSHCTRAFLREPFDDSDLGHSRIIREAPGPGDLKDAFDQPLVSVLKLLVEESIDQWIDCGVGVHDARHDSCKKVRQSFLLAYFQNNVDKEWHPT